MTPRPPPCPPRTGFTLIELMIVVVIMVVLAALAWPALTEAVQRSRRADGMAALAVMMQAQERWRANNPAYQPVMAELPGGQAVVSPDRHYDISLVEGSINATAYTARATARSSSPQAYDTRCQVLEVAVNGGRIIYRSLANGGTPNAAPDPCWAR